jgi:hypothetical protein
MLLAQNNQAKINNKHQVDASTIFGSTIKKLVNLDDINKIQSRMELVDRFKAEGKFLNTDGTNDDAKEARFIKKYIRNEEITMDLTKDSGKVLVLLTEAPTSNLVQWSSSISEAFGTIRTMISTGYHSYEVWQSIIFQLVYAFAVMQEKEIYIQNFNMSDNIYIKDLFYDSNNIGSWIYKVNGIEYYVPNYGYLLLIDSKFNDITKGHPNKVYKICGTMFKENCTTDFKNRIYDKFIEIINPSNFTYYLKQNGGMAVDDTTSQLLQKIYTESLSNKNIKDILIKCFPSYLHNRVGTALLLSEKERIINIPPKAKNRLVVWEEKNNVYKWVIYIEDINGLCKIISRDNNALIEHTVFKGSLYYYPNDEPISYVNKNNMRYDEKFIFETYSLC